MHIFFKIDSLLLCIVVLIFVLVNTNKKVEHRHVTTKLFIGLIISNILMVLLEIAWQVLEGNTFTNMRNVFSIVMLVYYIIHPFATFLAFFYLDYQIIQNTKKILKRLKYFWVFVLINLIVVVTNPLHQFVFTINQKGFYERGLWVGVLWLIGCILYLIVLLDININKNKLDSRKKRYILLLCIPILVGGLLQLLLLGISTLWIGMTLFILFINAYLQNTLVTIDYLTGIFNRRELDEYVNYKLSKSADCQISGVFVDIDHFKSINDNHGHLEGDEAIRLTANIINQTLRKGDFLSRYGGDEFVIIPNINDSEKLERLIAAIRKSVQDFNEKSSKPYRLSLSMGYDTYSGKDKDEFFALLDKHMYEEKRRKHSK